MHIEIAAAHVDYRAAVGRPAQLAHVLPVVLSEGSNLAAAIVGRRRHPDVPRAACVHLPRYFSACRRGHQSFGERTGHHLLEREWLLGRERSGKHQKYGDRRGFSHVEIVLFLAAMCTLVMRCRAVLFSEPLTSRPAVRVKTGDQELHFSPRLLHLWIMPSGRWLPVAHQATQVTPSERP